MENTIEIWHKQILVLSFLKLLELKVVCFPKLLSVGPSSFLQRLRNLETLTIEDCSSLEEMFDTEELDIEEGYAKPLSRLRDLTLLSLPGLMHLWSMDSKVYMGFQSLSTLTIHCCDSLVSIFSPSIAGVLVQLHCLDVRKSKKLRDVIARGRDGEIVEKIVFPNMKVISLGKLASLTAFCNGSYSLDCPLLEALTLKKCSQIDKFTAEKVGITNNGLEVTHLEGNLDVRLKHIFNEKVSFPSLEEFTLNFVNSNDICHSLPSLSLCKLRTLWAENCDKLLSVVTSSTLESLHNLQDLVVQCCGSLAVVFDLEGIVVEDEHVPPLSMLKKLVLRELPVLKHILKKGPTVKAVFQNLNTLKLHDCDSLQNLFPISIFRGIARLQKLDVRRCKMMEEIITKEEGNVVTANMIEFPELDSITLKSLPKLISFFPRKYTLKCPSLNAIWVKDCPKMKSKSICGHEGSKKLVRIQAGLDEWLWRSASCNTFEYFSLNDQYVAMELVVESDTDDTLAGVSISNDYLGETDNQEKVTHLKEMSITAIAPRGNGEEPPQEVPQGAPSSNVPKTRATSVKGKGIASSSGNKQSQHNKTTTITITELAILESDTSDNSDEANFSTQPEVGRRANREEGSTSKATLIQG